MQTKHRAQPSRPPGVAPVGHARATRKPVGRPAGRSGEDTRGTILDQAERLFADGGYDGTSIRDIASRSGVQAAVVGYHFGSKDDLFDAVVGRRMSVLNAQRAEALSEVLARRRGRPVPLEALIRGYVGPLVQATSHGDPGWRHFATLMGRLANSPRGVDTIERHADGMARAYLVEFERALPGLTKRDLIDGFLYMVSAMLFVSAGTGRWERLQDRAHTAPRDPEDVLAVLVPFVAGGFRALRSRARA